MTLDSGLLFGANLYI